MTRFLRRLPNSASPGMMALSLLLHGTLILAIIIISYSRSQFQKPIQGSISRVKMVEGVSRPPAVEKLHRGPSKRPELSQREPVPSSEATPEISDNVREKVEVRTLKPAADDSIRLAKRKKPPRRVETAKPLEKKPEEAVEKKEQAQSFLDKRLAAIRRDVENKKTDTVESRSNSAGPQNDGSREGNITDRELLRWLDLVKGRINSRWSVFVDSRPVGRVTVIGVRLADDGQVIDVSIDDSSGDDAFDRSAMRAVLQATPFPPLAADARERILKAGGLALRFTPRGLQ